MDSAAGWRVKDGMRFSRHGDTESTEFFPFFALFFVTLGLRGKPPETPRAISRSKNCPTKAFEKSVEQT
jgi:hypothetical protein